jgi:hypothetical protein
VGGSTLPQRATIATPNQVRSVGAARREQREVESREAAARDQAASLHLSIFILPWKKKMQKQRHCVPSPRGKSRQNHFVLFYRFIDSDQSEYQDWCPLYATPKSVPESPKRPWISLELNPAGIPGIPPARFGAHATMPFSTVAGLDESREKH